MDQLLGASATKTMVFIPAIQLPSYYTGKRTPVFGLRSKPIGSYITPSRHRIQPLLFYQIIINIIDTKKELAFISQLWILFRKISEGGIPELLLILPH